MELPIIDDVFTYELEEGTLVITSAMGVKKISADIAEVS